MSGRRTTNAGVLPLQGVLSQHGKDGLLWRGVQKHFSSVTDCEMCGVLHMSVGRAKGQQFLVQQFNPSREGSSNCTLTFTVYPKQLTVHS